MKKILSMLLILTMLLGCSAAMAEGMGVQVIGGPEIETEPVSLDDVKLGAEVTIDGYGILLPNAFSFEDRLLVYRQGRNDSDEAFYSGEEAEYALLYMNITNTTTRPKNYLEQCSVKVVYDDVYEYGGWFYQQNYDNHTWSAGGEWEKWSNKQNILHGINEADNFAIDQMYVGHYILGCTLPNAVVNGKKPLSMIITIDGNEITYNIRK